MSQLLANMPPLGLIDTLRFVFIHFLITVAGALLTGVWIFLLIAYGIPFLLTGAFR